MSESLKDDLDIASEKLELSISAYIRLAVQEKIDKK